MADVFVGAVRSTLTTTELVSLLSDIAHEMGFRRYALIENVDLRGSPRGLVNVKEADLSYAVAGLVAAARRDSSRFSLGTPWRPATFKASLEGPSLKFRP